MRTGLKPQISMSFKFFQGQGFVWFCCLVINKI